MDDKHASDASTIQPGMDVETTEGDLGEHDVSKPKVADPVMSYRVQVVDAMLILR